MIDVLNGTFVGIFGILLSASFCNISWTRKKHWQMTACMVGLMLLQGVAYFLLDYEAVQKLYPVLTHLPLVIVLFVFTKKLLWSATSVFVAYLCCELRRWLALLLVAVCGGFAGQGVVELFLTVPIFFLLYRFAAPAVRVVATESKSVQLLFGLIPVLEYLFSYVTQVYTKLLYHGGPVVVEFMSFVCSVAYLIFVLRTSKEKQMRSELEHAQGTLNLQVEQSIREIGLLRESQQQASTYRHDLRHHLQFISGCIKNGRPEQAQNYIEQIHADIEAHKVTRFCENETVNLVFSAFAERVGKQNIMMEIKAALPGELAVAESDLCVLLSNALENALHACQKQKALQKAAEIEVTVYENKERIFIQIVNSCAEQVLFERGLPVTKEPGHGLGVRSICAVVDKYQGICDFSVKDGKFILRVSL